MEFGKHRLIHRFELEDCFVCNWLNNWLSWNRDCLVYEVEALRQLWELVGDVEAAGVELLLLLGVRLIRSHLVNVDGVCVWSPHTQNDESFVTAPFNEAFASFVW